MMVHDFLNSTDDFCEWSSNPNWVRLKGTNLLYTPSYLDEPSRWYVVVSLQVTFDLSSAFRKDQVKVVFGGDGIYILLPTSDLLDVLPEELQDVLIRNLHILED